MNRAILLEFALAVLTTQLGALNRLLDTTQLNLREWGWSLVPPIGLLALWELGKLFVRWRMPAEKSVIAKAAVAGALTQ
jgi:Ca2+-transporting ATPase